LIEGLQRETLTFQNKSKFWFWEKRKKQINNLNYDESDTGGLKMWDENPVMTFPTKKRINTELFIVKRASLYIQKEI